MHIPPVHNRCALDFVIVAFSKNAPVSRAYSKAGNSRFGRGAYFKAPLYTNRAAVDRTPHLPQNALIRKQS